MQDLDGYTPLHLAVKSCEELKSSRPVRALLFKDAPFDIPDFKNRLPIDLTEEITTSHLKQELVTFLQ